MARKHTQNKIVMYDDYAEIVMTDRKGNEKARAKIDIDDIDKVKEYRWGLYNRGYVICTNKSNKTSLHRFIMNCPKDKVVDHINHDKLDNRKCNLRICTQQQNTINKCKSKVNTSGHTGVSWHKKGNKWQVHICVNNKQMHLGVYDDLEEAIKVRKEAEMKYFGEYKRQD